MGKKKLTRWHAWGMHLLISVAVAVSVLALMLALWYPGQLFEAAGGNDLLIILVGVDVRGGLVSVSGWTQETQMRGDEAIRRLQSQGATRFVYTNVDRDGMLEGPDLDEVRRISEAVRGRFLYSGGIGSVEDLEALRALRLVNLAGVISGKALYERRFTVQEGKEALA